MLSAATNMRSERSPNTSPARSCLSARRVLLPCASASYERRYSVLCAAFSRNAATAISAKPLSSGCLRSSRSEGGDGAERIGPLPPLEADAARGDRSVRPDLAFPIEVRGDQERVSPCDGRRGERSRCRATVPCRSPGRVEVESTPRRGDPDYAIEVVEGDAMPSVAGAIEREHRAGRGPGGAVVVTEIVPPQLRLAGAVGVHHERLSVVTVETDEEDLGAVGRPSRWAPVVLRRRGQRARLRSVGVHHVDRIPARGPRAVAVECDRRSVRRPRRIVVVPGRSGQPVQTRAVGVDDVDVELALRIAREGDLRPVGRPGRMVDVLPPLRPAARRQAALARAVGVHQAELERAADVGDPGSVRRVRGLTDEASLRVRQLVPSAAVGVHLDDR